MNKVLIVDDYPVVRLAIGTLLKREGLEVVGKTDNGLDAVHMVRELSPDLVVLDIGISQPDGLEVLARLHLLVLPPKVLILTTKPANLFAMRCMQAGAAGYISKYGDLAELAKAQKAIAAGDCYFPCLGSARKIA